LSAHFFAEAKKAPLFDIGVEIYVRTSAQLKEILSRFRSKFAGQYNFFDVATITKEYRAMKGPFGSDAAAQITKA